MKSEAFGGSSESPFRFRIPSTTVCSKEVGTGDHRANSNPQKARPCVWLLMTSDKSKLSAVGISPTTETKCPFWSTETIFPRFSNHTRYRPQQLVRNSSGNLLNWFQQRWRRFQEGHEHGSACHGHYLGGTPVNRVLVKTDVSDLYFQASDLLVGDRTFLDSPAVSGKYHIPYLLHVLGSLGHVENNVEGLVYAPNSLRLFRCPSHRSERLRHLRFVAVLANLSLLDQVQDRVFKRFYFDVDLVVLVGRLPFNRTSVPPNGLTVNHDRLGGHYLHSGLGDESVCNLKVQRPHS